MGEERQLPLQAACSVMGLRYAFNSLALLLLKNFHVVVNLLFDKKWTEKFQFLVYYNWRKGCARYSLIGKETAGGRRTRNSSVRVFLQYIIMRSVKLSKRVAAGPNAIRWMFKVASELDEQRVPKGLKPLISLGIGAPHMYVTNMSCYGITGLRIPVRPWPV